MNILAIDTSCDETAVAVTNGRRILSNKLFSQIAIHKEWGGVVPNLAKRAHEERIDGVVQEALEGAGMRMDDIDAVAVTKGPGLAIALGVGINTAKRLSAEHGTKLIGVNHMEGHIYSCFAQNEHGQPDDPFEFPYIVLLVSGGHTELILFTDHLKYEKLGATRDDAAGEAIDKAARLLLGKEAYPGGPLLEKLARSGNPDWHPFPVPMTGSDTLDFSYSGLKTAMLYALQDMDDTEREAHAADLAASFQKAIVKSLLLNIERAVKKHGVNRLVVGGGVVANKLLQSEIQAYAESIGGSVRYPSFPELAGDNAAMIGVVAHYYARVGKFIVNPDELERDARLSV